MNKLLSSLAVNAISVLLYLLLLSIIFCSILFKESKTHLLTKLKKYYVNNT